jgi:hypothetical protein
VTFPLSAKARQFPRHIFMMTKPKLALKASLLPNRKLPSKKPGANGSPARSATPTTAAATSLRAGVVGICRDCERKQERQAVVEWAQKLLAAPQEFLILDTETTGLEQPDICAVAVLSGTGEEMLLDTLVKPNVPVEPGARAVHGISDEQLAAAPGWAEVYPKLRRACRGRKLIMYNAAFDPRALKTVCELSGVEWKGLGRGGECLMEMYAQYAGDWSDYHESYKYQPLPGGDHTALGD